MILLIEDNPVFDTEVLNFIRREVAPSMTSADGTTHQYNKSYIISLFKERGIYEDIVKEMESSLVDYYEFPETN